MMHDESPAMPRRRLSRVYNSRFGHKSGHRDSILAQVRSSDADVGGEAREPPPRHAHRLGCEMGGGIAPRMGSRLHIKHPPQTRGIRPHTQSQPTPSNTQDTAMSVNIVLPSLSAWAASHLAGILQSKDQDHFNTAFDATFATHCNITVNGKPVSRDEYKIQLLEQSAADPKESGTIVHIEGQTEVQVGDQGQLVRCAIIATTYVVSYR